MGEIRALIIFIAWVSVTGVVFSQELSTSVFPSEDELTEALLNGEIDSVQYALLLEIIEHGIDSTNSYLLDEVPNLFFILTSKGSFTTDLESQQQKPFKPSLTKKTFKTGSLNQKYYHNLGESAVTWYRNTLKVVLNRHWQMILQTQRDKTGPERFTERNIAFSSRDGILRSLHLGNFNIRWGLGTVFGYHGKLFDFSDNLDGESFMFPDNGAFNGVCGTAHIYGMECRSLVSLNRDDNHSLFTTGTMIVWEPTMQITTGTVWGFNRLRNRLSGISLDDHKLGIYFKYSYSNGYGSFEGSGQAGEKGRAKAFVTEGRHHFGRVELKYAGWYYDDSYLDFTCGSKAAVLRNSIELAEVAFELANKRAGQAGMMIKTVVQPFEDWEFFNSVLLATLNKDTNNTEYLVGLNGQLSSHFSLGGDFLTSWKERMEISGSSNSDKRRFRIESRIGFNSLSSRIYFAYNIKENDNYISLFAGLKYQTAGLEKVEIWSNMERIENGVIEYWYLYLKTTQNILKNISLAVKLGNAYRRNSEPKNQTVVSAELNVVI